MDVDPAHIDPGRTLTQPEMLEATRARIPGHLEKLERAVENGLSHTVCVNHMERVLHLLNMTSVIFYQMHGLEWARLAGGRETELRRQYEGWDIQAPVWWRDFYDRSRNIYRELRLDIYSP